MKKFIFKKRNVWRWTLLALVLLFAVVVTSDHHDSPFVDAAVGTPKPQGISIKSFGAVGDGSTDDSAALVKASQLKSGVIYFPTGTYVLNERLTFPAQVTLVFGQHAQLHLGNGKSITINGSLKAGLYQIFSGTGKVVGSNKMKHVYPEWFGALGNASADDRLAIQHTLDFASQQPESSTVHFSAGKTYLLRTMTKPAQHVLIVNGKVSLDGNGTVKLADQIGIYNSVFEFPHPINNVSIKHLTVDANSANNPQNGQPSDAFDPRREFQMYTGNGATFEQVTIKNSLGVQSIMTNVVDRVVIKNCSFLNMGVNAANHFDTSAIYVVGNHSQITGNVFEAKGKGANTAIEIHGGQKIVSRNVINQYRTGVIFATEPSPQYSSDNILITNNTIQDVMYGISLWGVSDHVNGLTISSNRIRVKADAGGFLPANELSTGIQFYHPSNQKWSNIHISTNVIDFVKPSLPYLTSNQHSAGIDLGLHGSGSEAEGIMIQGNYIRNAYANGISWSVLGPSKQIIIEHNTIVNSGSAYNGNAGYSSGIALFANRIYISCYVRNNVIVEDRSPANMYTGLLLYSIGPSDNASTQLYWVNNAIATDAVPLSGKDIVTDGNTPIIQ
ncbi:glycoside hydrolase family 55 protein [Paenibacillus sp. 481]|uniref:glycoside hydrolase family 55 protein n=1 Tax=Paenibacillus sp. 481 TaxID=2835869 RepID=UPI001E3B573E|nr:glycoside hydrolase family 55 protein [Paenibacillus sp. 481]UHA71971.1 hypothetical protein KIK04_14680 [Paenibacillus sp. 481]